MIDYDHTGTIKEIRFAFDEFKADKWGDDPQEEALKSGESPLIDTWGEESEGTWGRINSNFNGKRLEGAYPTHPGNYMAFYDNVFDAIRHDAPLEVKPQEARNVIRIIEAAYESSARAEVINLV